MKGLNFSGFKKISSDGKMSVLRHEKGHELKILHSALPSIQREQLKRLPLAEGTPDGPLENKNITPESGSIPIQVPPSAPQASQTAPEPIVPAPAPAADPDFNTGAIGASQEAIDSEKQARASVQDAYKKVQAQAQAFDDYQKANPINPTHWAESLDSTQKADIAAGMALMGFGGSAATGFDFINKQIDRDVAAQQKNFENKKTVFGAYREMFGDSDIAAKLALASTNDIYSHRMAIAAMQRGTPGAIQAAQSFESQKKIQNAQLYHQVANQLVSEGQVQKPAQILSPDAQAKYQSLMFDPTKSPQQKADIDRQYAAAVQADKALSQIEQLFPQLRSKATWGGYLANKVNPNILGGTAAAITEGLGIAGALPSGGTSVAAAIPAAIAAGAGGTALGHGVKQGLTAIGGQQEEQYQTAKASLVGMIGSALAGAHVTPTEIGDLAEQFIPKITDSEETAKDKLQKLKEKIITLTNTSALDAAGMTNK